MVEIGLHKPLQRRYPRHQVGQSVGEDIYRRHSPRNGGEIRELTKCSYFRCRELKLGGSFTESNPSSFTAINFICGSGEINGEKFVAGDGFFVPRGEEFTITGTSTAILTTENN